MRTTARWPHRLWAQLFLSLLTVLSLGACSAAPEARTAAAAGPSESATTPPEAWTDEVERVLALLSEEDVEGAASAAHSMVASRATADPVAAADLARRLAEEFFYAASPRAWNSAEELHRRSLALLLEQGDRHFPALAEAHAELALHLYYLGRWDEAEAEDLAAQALRESHFGADSEVAAAGRIELAKVLWQQGRYAEAETLFRRSLTTLEALKAPDLVTLGDGLQGLAEVVRSQGDYRTAEPIFRRAIQRLRRSSAPDAASVTATALSNLSILLKDVGRYRESEQRLSEAEAIWSRDPDRFTWALNTVVINRAELLRFQGRFDEAAPLYEEAVRRTRGIVGDDNPALVWRLNQHGVFLALTGENDRAESRFREGLEILNRTLSEEHPLLAQASDDLAVFLCRGDRAAEANTLFDRALGIRRSTLGAEHPDTAQTLVHRARCLLDRGGDATHIRALVDEALEVLILGGPHPAERSDALAILAELEYQHGELDAAVESMRQAVAGVEAMRVETGGSDTARAASFSHWSRYFERLVAWELERGQIHQALEISERRRARVFLEQLAAGRVDLRRSIPAARLAVLEAEDRQSRARLAELQGQILFLLQRSDLRGAERNQRLATLQSDLSLASRQVDQAAARIRDASPLWQRLMSDRGETVSAAQLQQDLLTGDDLLLVYDVSATGSFLFLIPPLPGTLEVYALQIDESTPLTRQRLETLVAGSPQELGALTSLQGTRGLIKVGGAVGQSVADSTRLLQQLWEIVIPEPIRDRILAADQVAIVPDGALQRLPFAALVVEPPSPTGEITYWLDAGPAISYAASATVLANLEQRSPRDSWTPILAVADPDFSGEAEAPPTTPDLAADSDDLRRNFLRTDGRLPRLPGTRREAEGIEQLVTDEGLELLLGPEASETAVRQRLEEQPPTIHFATHGLVDESPGSLLAALALTPTASAAGEPQTSENDGFLQLFEIYELPLEAELVVLSACDSHVGHQVDGEGVFALSRGFLAAGSRRVLASQWPVDDASTAALMTAFYRELGLGQAASPRRSSARALQAAQREIRRQARWASPYHWAPFVLSGAR